VAGVLNSQLIARLLPAGVVDYSIPGFNNVPKCCFGRRGPTPETGSIGFKVSLLKMLLVFIIAYGIKME
jgi:hypothetical protein